MVLGNDVPHSVFQVLAGLLNDPGHRQDVVLGEDVVLCTDIDRLAEGVSWSLPLQVEHKVAKVVAHALCGPTDMFSPKRFRAGSEICCA